MRVKFLLLIGLFLMTLSGCATEPERTQVEEPAEVLFERATAALQAKEYREATRLFEEVDRQHPYSALASRAQLMASVSSYRDERYDDALIGVDRFIELHPGSDRIDYAYYLRALSYYDRIVDVARDQEMTDKALQALNTLIQRFPESKYRREAELKRDLTIDHLAGKEMEIGRYYLKAKQTNAALNRFRTVVEKYQTTTHAAEALYRLVEGYMILGIRHEARRVAVVLGYNYPGSPWYDRAYKLLDDELRAQLEEEQGVFKRTIDTLLDPTD